MLTLTNKAREMDASLVLEDQHSRHVCLLLHWSFMFQDQQDQSYQWSLNASVKTVLLYCFHTYHYINTNGSMDGENTCRDKIWNAKKREDFYTYLSWPVASTKIKCWWKEDRAFAVVSGSLFFGGLMIFDDRDVPSVYMKYPSVPDHLLPTVPFLFFFSFPRESTFCLQWMRDAS